VTHYTNAEVRKQIRFWHRTSRTMLWTGVLCMMMAIMVGSLWLCIPAGIACFVWALAGACRDGWTMQLVRQVDDA
jgi:hypothetical protein